MGGGGGHPKYFLGNFTNQLSLIETSRNATKHMILQSFRWQHGWSKKVTFCIPNTGSELVGSPGFFLGRGASFNVNQYYMK